MKKLIHIVSLFAIAFPVSAQHLEMLSGANSEPMLHNPAAAGEKGWMAVTIGRRNQWLGFDGAPKTTYLTLHTPLVNKKVNLGLLALRDEIGIFERNRINAVYAFRMDMGKIKVSFGLNAGIEFGKSSWSRLTLIQNPDQAFMNTDENFFFPDAGAGVQLLHTNFSTNFSVQHLLPQEFISQSPRLSYTFSGAYHWKMNNITWSPFLVVRNLHHSPVQAELQLRGTFNQAFTIGGGYRLNDAILIMAGFKLNQQIYLYYTYEKGLSALQDHHTGTHEILLRYEFGYGIAAESPRSQK